MVYIITWGKANLNFLATVLGICLIVRQLIIANKALNADTSLRLFEFWQSESTVRKRKLLPNLREKGSKRLDLKKVLDNDEARAAFIDICTFFEELGILVKTKAMGLKIAEKRWGGIVMSHWERYAHLIQEERKKKKTPKYFENFEWLKKEFKKIYAQLDNNCQHVNYNNHQEAALLVTTLTTMFYCGCVKCLILI